MHAIRIDPRQSSRRATPLVGLLWPRYYYYYYYYDVPNKIKGPTTTTI